MARPRVNTGLPAWQAAARSTRILDQLDADGADWVAVDDSHAYLWHREQLVNLWDHQQLLDFLAAHGYIGPRTENRMIIAAWIIFAGVQRCA